VFIIMEQTTRGGAPWGRLTVPENLPTARLVI
jgi:hypothetical protein